MPLPGRLHWHNPLRRAARAAQPDWLRLRRHPNQALFSERYDLPPHEGGVSLYLVAMTPWSGARFLAQTLWPHGYFGMPLEYMNHGAIPLLKHRFDSDDMDVVLQALFRHRSGPTGLFGIAAHWEAFDRFTHTVLLERQGDFRKAIWLYRRDLLAQAVACERSRQNEAGMAGTFDPDAIRRMAEGILRQNDHWAGFFATQFTRPVRRQPSEDIAPDLPAIAAFLDPEGPVPVAGPPQPTSEDPWYAQMRDMLGPDDAWILVPQSY